MAIGYYRLGDKKKSEEYAKKFDERYKLKIVGMKEMFKGEKMQVQIDEEYRQRIDKLYEKIGMK